MAIGILDPRWLTSHASASGSSTQCSIAQILSCRLQEASSLDVTSIGICQQAISSDMEVGRDGTSGRRTNIIEQFDANPESARRLVMRTCALKTPLRCSCSVP